MEIRARDIGIISQLPPPVHGSTVMTQFLIEVLSEEFQLHLVDRRFSSSIADVGRRSPKKLLAGVGLLARLWSATRARRLDAVIFFTTNRIGSFVVDWAMSEMLRLRKMPTIHYVHTSGYKALAHRRGPWRWMIGRLLGQASMVVCLGDSLRDDISNWVSAGDIRIIPNAVGRASTPPMLDANESLQVLYFSNLIPEKGVGDYLELARKVGVGGARVKFYVAGADTDRSFAADVRSNVEELARDFEIEFIGPVFGQAKWDLLEKTSILIFPSTYKYEAQPLTIIEAMSASTPVIAYDVGGISDLVLDQESGFLVTPKDIEGMADRFRTLEEDRGLLAKLANSARRQFDEKHSKAAYRSSWSDAIESVITSGVTAE